MKDATFARYLKDQALLHPRMRAQDGVKLCYQAAFGAEHLLTDPAHARAALGAEWEQTAPRRIEVFEPISAKFSRCNLAAWKEQHLPLEWLDRIFWHSASEKREEAGPLFMEYLQTVTACAEQGVLPFNREEWRGYLDSYLAGGVRPVHHSEAYRQREKPAYRVVKREYERLLPVFQRLVAIPKQAEPKIIAIDGRAAAGKTTLAALLSHILAADVIRMDDFFLPAELRTAERLAQSGGNIHYERFCSEVLPYLKKKESFSYRRFDCGSMDYAEARVIQSSSWRIVEGSYSCHPAFGEYMDCRVFCDISADEQMKRIIKRNGPEMAEVFAEEWIPLEEQYFKAERIKAQADVIIK
jgi:uridine kinase